MAGDCFCFHSSLGLTIRQKGWSAITTHLGQEASTGYLGVTLVKCCWPPLWGVTLRSSETETISPHFSSHAWKLPWSCFGFLAVPVRKHLTLRTHHWPDISLTVLKTSSFLGSRGSVFVKASLKQNEWGIGRMDQPEFLPSASPPVLNDQLATHPRNATGRMLTSPLIFVQFLKESMFVAFMERIPFSSPIPMPLHTVKVETWKSGGEERSIITCNGINMKILLVQKTLPLGQSHLSKIS